MAPNLSWRPCADMLFYCFPISSKKAHSLKEQFMLFFCPTSKKQSLIRSLGALAGQLFRQIVASEKLRRGGLAGIAFIKQSFIDVIVQIYADFITDWTDLAWKLLVTSCVLQR